MIIDIETMLEMTVSHTLVRAEVVFRCDLSYQIRIIIIASQKYLFSVNVKYGHKQMFNLMIKNFSSSWKTRPFVASRK